MNKIAHEIAQKVTDQQVQRLAKVENLMKLKTTLQEDHEEFVESFGEMIEQRAETCFALGVDITPFTNVLADLSIAFERVRKNAQSAQLEAIKTG